MGERSRAVYDLWRLDGALQSLETKIQSLATQLGDQVQVKAADIALRRAREATVKAQSRQRDDEFALAQLVARIKDHDTLLWSGKGSPRDLESLRLELERERILEAKLEEQALKAMEATERAQRDFGRVEAAVSAAFGSMQAGNTVRVAERLSALQQRDELTLRRATLASQIDAEDLATYSRLRTRASDGVPVAILSGPRCEGCRTDLPTSVIQLARRQEAPMPCPSCGRLLHAV